MATQFCKGEDCPAWSMQLRRQHDEGALCRESEIKRELEVYLDNKAKSAVTHPLHSIS